MMMVTAETMMAVMITCQIDLSTTISVTHTHVSFHTLHCTYTTVNNTLSLECFWWVHLA